MIAARSLLTSKLVSLRSISIGLQDQILKREIGCTVTRIGKGLRTRDAGSFGLLLHRIDSDSG